MSEPSRREAGESAALFEAKTDWHRKQARLPPREKVRILLELQKQDYPLLVKRPTLAWWERPWEIEP